MMSEKLEHNHESHEHWKSPEAQEHTNEHHTEKKEHHHVEAKREDVEAIKHEAEKEAKSANEVKVDSGEKEPEHHYVSAELRQEALHRSLQRARKHLSKANKTFSKAVHQPVIDAVSKAGEKTIARPKGLLLGSILALAGSSYVLYSAKHYGYTYNFGVVIILFAGGYALGLLLEFLIYMFRRLARRA